MAGAGTWGGAWAGTWVGAGGDSWRTTDCLLVGDGPSMNRYNNILIQFRKLNKSKTKYTDVAESPAIFTEVAMGCGTYVPPFCRKSCYRCYGRRHCFYGSRVMDVIIGSAAI